MKFLSIVIHDNYYITRIHTCSYMMCCLLSVNEADDELVTTVSDRQSSGQLSTADGEYLILYSAVSITHCTHYYCDIVAHYYEARLTASKEEQQRLLQVVKQWQRMSHARDVQISQLQNENELVQDKCKLASLEAYIPIHVNLLTINVLFRWCTES